MASPIPDGLPYENAAVLPLGLSTAACGLFQKDYLGLQPPLASPPAARRTLLVWGGSTSVGSNAIQLAAAAGYEVFATASPKNFAYVKSLGAAQAFDYNSPTVVADIVERLRDRPIAGAIAIGIGSTDQCLRVVRACRGNRFVASASPPVSFAKAPAGRGRVRWLIPVMARMAGANAATTLRSRMWGVRTKFINGPALMNNEVSRLIYGDFLPQALARNRYITAPPPDVIGHGLNAIPAALTAQRQGVSARKIVVTL